MKYVVSVSKTYIHRGNHRHQRKTKRRWHIYYYDDQGKFCTKRVNWLEALYYKTQKCSRYKMVCPDCGSVFIAIVSGFRNKVECPYCEN